MIKNHLDKLIRFLSENNLDAVIVKKIENVCYFSGFYGDDTVLLIAANRKYLITDSRYTEQAALQAPLFDVILQKDGLWREVNRIIEKGLSGNRIAFEGNFLTYDEYKKIDADVIKSITSVNLDQLRILKDDYEISCLRKAADIANKAYNGIISCIRPGISENEVAFHLEMIMRKLGSERPAFTTIVASGKRGSLPHGIATEKLIVDGEFVTMDYGAVYKGYHSDITRTVAVGNIDSEKRRLYDVVLNAQLLGIKHAVSGVSGSKPDVMVREYLKRENCEQYFTHGLGHGVGLEIHEAPRLSSKSDCEKLLPGMIVTVEPGIYIPDCCGIRIEDTVLVTAEGNEILTNCSKQFKQI